MCEGAFGTALRWDSKGLVLLKSSVHMNKQGASATSECSLKMSASHLFQ
jgi:hypothetical protein